MMTDERRNQTIRLHPAGDHVFKRVVASALTAGVRFLVGVERGIGEKAMLEIIDPKRYRFLVGH